VTRMVRRDLPLPPHRRVGPNAVCGAVMLVLDPFLAYERAGDGVDEDNWRDLALAVRHLLDVYTAPENGRDDGGQDDDSDDGPDDGPMAPSPTPSQGKALSVSTRRPPRRTRVRHRRAPAGVR
jgi:hypothetical protein